GGSVVGHGREKGEGGRGAAPGPRGGGTAERGGWLLSRPPRPSGRRKGGARPAPTQQAPPRTLEPAGAGRVSSSVLPAASRPVLRARHPHDPPHRAPARGRPAAGRAGGGLRGGGRPPRRRAGQRGRRAVRLRPDQAVHRVVRRPL